MNIVEHLLNQAIILGVMTLPSTDITSSEDSQEAPLKLTLIRPFTGVKLGCVFARLGRTMKAKISLHIADVAGFETKGLGQRTRGRLTVALDLPLVVHELGQHLSLNRLISAFPVMATASTAA